MHAAAIAERQETDGLAWQAQRDLPGLSFPASGRIDQEDQSDSARVGEILCHRPLESVFLIHPILGRKEDPAPSGPSVPASRMRLEAVGQGMAVRNPRTLLGVSGFLWTVDLGSRSGLIGLITLDVNCAGARSAGNPLATCDVAGAGNQLTVRIVRHSQRKRGATDRPDLRSRRQSSTLPRWDFDYKQSFNCVSSLSGYVNLEAVALRGWEMYKDRTFVLNRAEIDLTGAGHEIRGGTGVGDFERGQ